MSERYNLVTKAKVSEKRYRLQKRFSGALKLLGDGFADSGKLMVCHITSLFQLLHLTPLWSFSILKRVIVKNVSMLSPDNWHARCTVSYIWFFLRF